MTYEYQCQFCTFRTEEVRSVDFRDEIPGIEFGAEMPCENCGEIDWKRLMSIPQRSFALEYDNRTYPCKSHLVERIRGPNGRVICKPVIFESRKHQLDYMNRNGYVFYDHIEKDDREIKIEYPDHLKHIVEHPSYKKWKENLKPKFVSDEDIKSFTGKISGGAFQR